jgi:hypothetical protein
LEKENTNVKNGGAEWIEGKRNPVVKVQDEQIVKSARKRET